MLVEAIYSLLSTVNVNTYPGVTEQEVDPPFIVHSFVRAVPHHSKDGASSMDYKILKVASYATLPDTAQSQADAVRTVLDEYVGVKNSVDIDRILFQDEETGYEPTVDLYFTLQTYKIWINFNT